MWLSWVACWLGGEWGSGLGFELSEIWETLSPKLGIRSLGQVLMVVHPKPTERLPEPNSMYKNGLLGYVQMFWAIVLPTFGVQVQRLQENILMYIPTFDSTAR